MPKFVLLFILTLFSFQSVADEAVIDRKLVKSLQKEGHDLYQVLLVLKRDSGFLARGFGDPKSKRWDNKVEALRDKCSAELQNLPLEFRVQGDMADVCRAIHYMAQMGLRYALHKSMDDDFTNKVRVQVESTFGVIP